jgi:FlaA1/EpsC-like NDP-sugar epimerase
MLKGKSVLVTGAGGSIGSVLCEELIRRDVRQLKMLSLTESGLYNITRRLKALGSGVEIKPILGSVTNEKLVDEVVEGVDVVIHAAAHKHLPICEENPVEAVVNNVFGTKTLLDAAVEFDVQQFMLISTDKAVRPVSVMGSTKRVAELLVKKAAQTSALNASVVRFGNVLDSAGSVLPLWREQMAAGGPITITDERCERYFMSIPEACELVLESLVIARAGGSGLFVFDMGQPRRLADIAQQMITASGMRCEIKCIGLRPGEKLTEEIHFGGQKQPTMHPKIFRVEEDKQEACLHLLEELRSFAMCRSPDTGRVLREIAA